MFVFLFPFLWSACTGYQTKSKWTYHYVCIYFTLGTACCLSYYAGAAAAAACCWQCCWMSTYIRFVRCAALLLLAAVVTRCVCCMIRTGYRPKVRACYYYLGIFHWILLAVCRTAGAAAAAACCLWLILHAHKSCTALLLLLLYECILYFYGLRMSLDYRCCGLLLF